MCARSAGREVLLFSLSERESAGVIGFDCSSKTVGWGLVVNKDGSPSLAAHGHIRPLGASYPLMRRLSDLYDRIDDLCARLHPQRAAVEDIALFMKGGGSTARTITTLAVFNRTVALAAFRRTGDVGFYTVQSIRKLVRQACGRKKAIGKDEMPSIVQRFLSSEFCDVEKRQGGRAEQTFDEADGIAVAWACACDTAGKRGGK